MKPRKPLIFPLKFKGFCLARLMRDRDSMCRKSEVRSSRWREFDLDKSLWDLPAVRMKMKLPHRVHLSLQAVDGASELTRAPASAGRLLPNDG